MKKIMFFTGKCDEKYFHFGGHLGFSGKAERTLEGLTTKFHPLPLEKLCTKFSAFVSPKNIMLKNDAEELINIHSGMVTKTLHMTQFGIFYFVAMLSILLSNHVPLEGIQRNQTYKKKLFSVFSLNV